MWQLSVLFAWIVWNSIFFDFIGCSISLDTSHGKCAKSKEKQLHQCFSLWRNKIIFRLKYFLRSYRSIIEKYNKIMRDHHKATKWISLPALSTVSFFSLFLLVHVLSQCDSDNIRRRSKSMLAVGRTSVFSDHRFTQNLITNDEGRFHATKCVEMFLGIPWHSSNAKTTKISWVGERSYPPSFFIMYYAFKTLQPRFVKQASSRNTLFLLWNVHRFRSWFKNTRKHRVELGKNVW